MGSENIDKVLQKLEDMEIKYEMTEHETVYTIEDMHRIGICEMGEVAKNLFLRDEKGRRYFLVIMTGSKTADLKALREKLGVRLSFAQEDKLMVYLGLTKGSVSPFGVINDADAFVEVIFDRDLSKCDRLGFHPNDNTATLWISYSDIEKVIKQNGNKMQLITI